MSNFIGPVLPPHLLNRISPDEDSDHAENDKQIPKNSNSQDVQLGTTLSPHILEAVSEGIASSNSNRELPEPLIELKSTTYTTDVIGPQLLSHIGSNSTVKQSIEIDKSLSTAVTFNDNKEASGSTIGPTLPLKLRTKLTSKSSKASDSSDEETGVVGPILPPQLKKSSDEDNLLNIPGNRDVIGPRLPPLLMSKNDEQFEICKPQQETTCNKNKEISGSTIGPTLPLKLRNKLSIKSSKTSDSSDEETGVIGPALPPHLKSPSDEDDSQDIPGNVCVIGPRLPPFLTSKNNKQFASDASDKIRNKICIIGPSLPQHLKSKLEDELPTVVEDVIVNDQTLKPVIGPSLSQNSNLKDKILQDQNNDSEEMYGPALPPGLQPKTTSKEVKANEFTESDEDDMGPLPEGNVSNSKVHHQLELRAQQLRQAIAAGELSTSDMPTQRESWMLELPADRAPELGLRPRQFRVREGPEAGDRSVWTDTPADRERKKKTLRSRSPDRGVLEQQAAQQRDKAMQQLAEQHSSKRGVHSLLELHEEKLLAKRKKAEEAGEVHERRPFSREVDLQVNRFDEAQKRSILKKAQHLNDRFSSGQSKFL